MASAMIEIDGVAVHVRTENKNDEASISLSIRPAGMGVGDEDVWLSVTEARAIMSMMENMLNVCIIDG